MSFLCVGDIHFKKDNSIESDEFIEKLIFHVIQTKYDFIVLLGDILDTFEHTHYQTYGRVCRLFKELNKICKTFIIVGNHDRPNNNVFLTDEHFFNPFKKYKNITIVDKPVLYSFNEKTFMFVPYVAPGRFDEALSEYDIKKEKLTCIFAHQEFKGCKIGMLKSEIGDVWPTDNVPIISGHIHEFHIPQSNIFYVPTPFQHGFGDVTEKFLANFLLSSKLNSTHYTKDLYYIKIKLDITKKRILNMNLDKFKDFIKQDIDKSFITKIILEGIGSTIREYFKQNPIVNKNIKIQIKDISERKKTILDNKFKDKDYNLRKRIRKVLKEETDELKEEYKRLYI
jgi:predicted phosphodiesterase